MANTDKISVFLAKRVAAGKMTQAEADAAIAKRAAKVPAGLVGKPSSGLTNAQQNKLLEVIATRLGLADSSGVIL